MYEYKLQAACMVVILYIIIVYVFSVRNTGIKYNKSYLALLFLAPVTVFFDGTTAWTVNHMDVVPGNVNFVLHLLFFLSMNALNMMILFYTITQSIGETSRKKLAIYHIPGTISMIGILVFMKDTYYIHGKTTWYSMGISVVFCYVALLLHEVIILGTLLMHWRHINRVKRASVLGFYAIMFAILIIQVIFPESLISSAFPMVAVVGTYICFEDPSIRKMQVYNEEMVAAFSTLVENRDDKTGGHIKRTKGYVKILLREMSMQAEYHSVMTADYIESVLKAAPLHDIGKISTPDSILQKPGKLTDEEFSIMQQHTVVGGELIKETFADIDSPESKQIAYEVARFHHEKWNGRGYPDGLKGEEIPLHARIMAIADVFDAVSEKRCYRDALSIEESFKIIEEGAGEHFDPKLAELFLEAKDEVIAYHEASR